MQIIHYLLSGKTYVNVYTIEIWASFLIYVILNLIKMCLSNISVVYCFIEKQFRHLKSFSEKRVYSTVVMLVKLIIPVKSCTYERANRDLIG